MGDKAYICPRCKNPIHDDDALRCLYCGERLNRPVGFMQNVMFPMGGIILIMFIIILLVCFIAYIL